MVPEIPLLKYFLQKVRPKYTIISAGIENSYGHPHRETIERIRKNRQPDLSYGKLWRN